MNLVIDIGNTRTKTAAFKNGSVVAHLIETDLQQNHFFSFIQNNGPFKACIISATVPVPEWLTEELKHAGISPLILQASTPLPFKNTYQSKESLGYDRIAAIAGAFYLYPRQNVLVIDAGTALTYDLKSRNEEYLGGNIAPGLTMRFRALHEFTSKLPHLQPGVTTEILGRSTDDAIRNGVQQGIAWEMEHYIDVLSNKYDELVVILTGGDAHFFENMLKKPIFVVSDLTLIGLNIILHYNAQNK
jgi:type III pantothenate kinase